jgi:hypothetical protein
VTVRRRLLGPTAAFLAALAVTTAGHAQPPFWGFPQPGFEPPGPGRDITTDDVKKRLEQYFHRNRPGAKLDPFGPGLQLPPEVQAQLAKMAEEGKLKPGPNGKLDPSQEAFLKQFIEQNPAFRKQLEQARQKDGTPPFNAAPDNVTRPFDPNLGKGNPKFPDFKVQPPPQRPTPPDTVPPPPIGKGEPINPPVRPENPSPLGSPRNPREMLPGEEPESPQDKARQAAAAMWENNVGPLDETPAVKKALFDLADGSLDLKDPDGNNFLETLGKEFGDGKAFGDLLNGVEPGGDWNLGGGNWDFPKLNWNFNWGNNRPPDLNPGSGNNSSRESWWSRWRRSPSSSSSSSSSSSGSSWFSGWKAPKWNIGIPALDGTWLPVVFLIAALVAGVFLWRWLARRGLPDARIDPYALGPWPVDPHRLASRQDVVVAFEHLSVLICGPVARTWTHTTIAAALSELALAEPERAMMLARLYELARYTPVEEPLTTAELAEARRLVCRLAGFSDD